MAAGEVEGVIKVQEVSATKQVSADARACFFCCCFFAKTVKERLENVLLPAACSIMTSMPVGSLMVWGGEPSQPKGTVAVRSICWGGGSESGAQQHQSQSQSQSQSESCWVPETEPHAGAVGS